MTDYQPLYVDGKRDKARRYVTPTGEIISRREHIKRTEKRTPEAKAYKRYIEGKAPKGKTVERILKKQDRIRAKTRKKGVVVRELDTREMNQNRNAYQLTGRYRFINKKWRLKAQAIGYSTVTKNKKYGPDFAILRTQAVNNAQATLPHSGWEFYGIDYEHWLHW